MPLLDSTSIFWGISTCAGVAVIIILLAAWYYKNQ